MQCQCMPARCAEKQRQLEWIFSTVKQYVGAGVGCKNAVTIPLITIKKIVSFIEVLNV